MTTLDVHACSLKDHVLILYFMQFVLETGLIAEEVHQMPTEYCPPDPMHWDRLPTLPWSPTCLVINVLKIFVLKRTCLGRRTLVTGGLMF